MIPWLIAGGWIVGQCFRETQVPRIAGLIRGLLRSWEIRIPVTNELSFIIGDKPDVPTGYPTSRLAKGLVLRRQGLDLAEEAVGFGVPVLMRGLQALFPGEAELHLLSGSPNWALTAEYSVNLAERLGAPGKKSVQGEFFYGAKNFLSDVRARFPPARVPLMSLSSGLRRLFGWETTFEQADFGGQVKMTYRFDERTGVLSIDADLSRLQSDSVTEVIVMNEQGAHYFDEYQDSSGNHLVGKEIGCWDEVKAEEASFSSPAQRIAFTVHHGAGCALVSGPRIGGLTIGMVRFWLFLSPTHQALQVHTERQAVLMTSVLLIYPFFMPRRDRSVFRFPPLGIAYIAASLRQAGHDVHLLDCTFLSREAAMQRGAGERRPRWSASTAW